MDVDSYIAKYGPEWRTLDQACAKGAAGLARMSGSQISEVVRLYRRASAHLAEVQGTYHDQRLLTYLNGVVARAHAALYGGKPRSLQAGLRLFGARYREAIHRTAPFIAAMAAIMVLVTIAMTIWVATSRQAQAGILPPFARDTISHAGGHRPDLGIAPAGLATSILVNNVQVAFLAYATGIGLGIGTIYLVIRNALLLGALAGAYQAAGRAGVFWSLVLPHGLLELTAICIAAGAGMRMGWSLIDPGERSRGRALTEESRDAGMVVLGVIPAFVVAAAIEGFVTGTSVPAAVQLALGAAVAALYVAFLFGWRLPRRTAGRAASHSRPNALIRRY